MFTWLPFFMLLVITTSTQHHHHTVFDYSTAIKYVCYRFQRNAGYDMHVKTANKLWAQVLYYYMRLIKNCDNIFHSVRKWFSHIPSLLIEGYCRRQNILLRLYFHIISNGLKSIWWRKSDKGLFLNVYQPPSLIK